MQAYLDIREINGYSIQYTQFRPADPSLTLIKCLVYIGLPDNPQFVGPQDPEVLAEHIWKSKGPSGENKEYLFMLEQALQGLTEESRDGHVQDLAHRVRKIVEVDSKQSAGTTLTGNEAAGEAVSTELRRVQSGETRDQHEEVENHDSNRSY